MFISAKGIKEHMSIINLDGRVDWNITQRKSLLAWIGPTLQPNVRLSRLTVLERSILEAHLAKSAGHFATWCDTTNGPGSGSRDGKRSDLASQSC